MIHLVANNQCLLLGRVDNDKQLFTISYFGVLIVYPQHFIMIKLYSNRKIMEKRQKVLAHFIF